MGEHSRPRGRHEGRQQPVSKPGFILLISGILAVCALIGVCGKLAVSLTSDSRPVIGTTVTVPGHHVIALPQVKPVIRSPHRTQAAPVYRVAGGDCLWTIARDRLGSGLAWKIIARINHLASPWIIHPGQLLKL